MGMTGAFGFIGGRGALTTAVFRVAAARRAGLAFFRAGFFLTDFLLLGRRAGFLAGFLTGLRAVFLVFLGLAFRVFFGMDSSFLRYQEGYDR
jgi:hypothetical protein